MTTYTVFEDGETRPANQEEIETLMARDTDAAAFMRADMNCYLVEVRDLRERLLNRLGGIAFRAQLSGEVDIVGAYEVACKRLLDITRIPGAALATTRSDLEAAIKAEYKAIVVQAPEALRSAFKEIDT